MLGFLDSEVHLPAVPPITNTAKLDVMSIYVQDVNKKLAVFDGLATKLRVFTDILRNRFQYKTFSIHRDRGIVFTSPDNSNLPINALSSGEQHEIVMLYELLFKAKKDSLVLIDEPELSLHLLWQQSFLDDLLKIVKLSNIDVLLATHSADLIGAHWDLTEALTGPKG
jgi:predicted ATP-dependent endonuclease of OLD family